MTDAPDLTGWIGYSLEGREGRIGSIAAVLPPTGGRPGLLIVHSRALSCGLSAVSVDQVDRVEVEERRIVLRDEPATLQDVAP